MSPPVMVMWEDVEVAMAQMNPTAMFITTFSPAPGCLTMATQQLQNKDSTRDHHFLLASTF